ncbi:MAG: flagellar filament capping protein FliD [Synergistaceae bacterium]|jgi:flagellar capping protein FliD|nr:flagellar filament capping protein FliD [Synergistaceae bacterium]
MADMAVSGVASGIDWDSIVEKLIENASKPALVQQEKRDTLELKKSLFEEFLVSLQAVQSALSPLKLASTFKAKMVEIERLDSNASYKGVLTAVVNSDAEINVHNIIVERLAKAQITRSDQKTVAQALSSMGVSDSYFYINAGGKKIRIDVSSSDTNLEDVASRINTQLKTQSPAIGVTASVVDGRLILKSDQTGLGTTTQDVTVTRTAGSKDSLGYTISDGAAVVISDGNGNTWTQGVDFDIVNGSQIRWRQNDSLVPPPGATYQDTYTAFAGDTYKVTATRSDSGYVDSDVLPFTTVPGYSVTITSQGGAITYTQGVDYKVGADGSIRWNSDDFVAIRPDAGEEYEVTYVAAGGEQITMDITRNNRDTISSVNFSDYTAGSGVVTDGTTTWKEGIDFDVVQSSLGEVVVRWYEGGAETSPVAGGSYTFSYKDSTTGTTLTAAGVRDTKDVADIPNGGEILVANGTHQISYSFDGTTQTIWTHADFTPTAGSGGKTLEINWNTPTGTPTAHAKATPALNSTYTVSVTSNTNTFTLTDDGNGFLSAMGLDKTDEDHYTAAVDAVLVVDGERVTRSSNQIGESYGNELIKGMTLQLKGVGEVYLDVSQDAETAVTAIQSFLTAYNETLSWIDTRMTEKELDETKKATVDSDDFRLKWGLLNGNSLLRSSKDSMRRITSNIYASPFTTRTARNAVYGTMAQNGFSGSSIMTVTVGARTASITVEPGDTLQSIAAKINSPQINGQNNPLFYDAEGREYPIPFAKAEVVDNRLVISAGTEREVTLGGSSTLLNTLGIGYEYSALSQVGIKYASTGQMSDQSKSGALDFDTSVFMAALEDNSEDVAMLMTNFAETMQTWLDDMIKSSQKEVTTGVTTAQGAVVREMNAIDTEIASIDEYLEKFTERLLAKQTALQTQFAAAETNLAKLMQQASWLASVTSQLSANTASNSSSS